MVDAPDESHNAKGSSSNVVTLSDPKTSDSKTINNLPTELLIEIFTHALPVRKRRIVSRCIAPLQLTHVCSRWRTIASQTTILWTSLDLWGPSPSYTRSLRIPLRHWLARASQRPVSLRFRMMDDSRRSGCAYFVHALDHVRELSLSMCREHYEPLFDLGPGSMPLLESVTLCMRGSRRSAQVTRQGSINFGSCSALRKVVLHSSGSHVGFLSTDMVSNLPMEQLVFLTVHEVSLHPYAALKHVVQCTNLEECTLVLGAYGSREGPFPDLPSVVLERLRKLDITFSGKEAGGKISLFFQPLTMPSLISLEITATMSSADLDLSSVLVGLHTRSMFPLRTFTLVNISVMRAPLRAFLHAVPSLRSLKLQSAPGSNHRYHTLFHWFRYDPSRAAQILPNLIDVFICDNVSNRFSKHDGHAVFIPFNLSDQLDDHTTLRALASRFWNSDNGSGLEEPGLRRLEKATMRWRNVPVEWRSLARDVMLGVEYLRGEGLDVYLPLEECRSRCVARFIV
ncbi:hypothetical protein Hypma_005427 [Hypsizygus marmoreus]|uniref:F-box domain-containing protein n=1 Tax=Hypsizygus marmoreus TaxID=39966 RepID=A0A369J6E9_HYPMA|nr:hypothetical protein Hypma_005427 [Hypsizygus marmoreus]